MTQMFSLLSSPLFGIVYINEMHSLAQHGMDNVVFVVVVVVVVVVVLFCFRLGFFFVCFFLCICSKSFAKIYEIVKYLRN